MCYLDCVDETPNLPHFDLAQGPRTFLYGTRVKDRLYQRQSSPGPDPVATYFYLMDGEASPSIRIRIQNRLEIMQ